MLPVQLNLSNFFQPPKIPDAPMETDDHHGSLLQDYGIVVSLYICIWVVSAGAPAAYHGFAEVLRTLRLALRDFSNGHFYVPFRREKDLNVVVRDQTLLQEISEAPELSQRAVYAQIFGFEHSLAGLDIEEVKASRARLFHRMIQVDGQRRLEPLYSRLSERLARLLDDARTKHVGSDGTSLLPSAATCQDLMTEFYSEVFWGPLADEPEFARALRQWPQDAVNVIKWLKLTPKFMHKQVWGWVTNDGEAMKTIMRILVQVFDDYAGNAARLSEFGLAHNMYQFTAETRSYWTSHRMAQALLGIWLGAAFQPYTNLHALLVGLCERSEYAELIRQEIGDFESHDYQSLTTLPLFDSYIKESLRTNPLDQMSLRRKALRPLLLSNGQFVPENAVVSIASQEILSDESNYPKASTFDAYRFVPTASSLAQRRTTGNDGSRTTDVAEKWPVWGYGSLACPGRFHALLSLKLCISLILTKYEVSLERPNQKDFWRWDTFTVGKRSTRFVVKPLTQHHG